MTQEEKQTLFIQIDELLDIFNEYAPIQDNGTVVLEVIKPTFLQMIEYIVPDEMEANALIDYLDSSDFWTAPASSKFHGDYKGGLSAHSLMVIKQSLIFAKPMSLFWKAASPLSSPTPRAAVPPPLLLHSPRPASVWSVRSPSVRLSPTPTAPSLPSSVTWVRTTRSPSTARPTLPRRSPP